MALDDMEDRIQEALKGYAGFRAVEGGFIASMPEADLLAPVSKCECKWGLNDCPNEVFMVIVCEKVRGFTVCCEPHAINFSSHVDPFDGTYSYLKPDQFDAAKNNGLYTTYATFADYRKAIMELVSTYQDALRLGLFPR